MTVDPATITCPPAVDASARFVPTGQFRGSLEEFDYVEEEWFASGEVDGHPYTTALTVRRPRDPAHFSGTVVVEPVHRILPGPRSSRGARRTSDCPCQRAQMSLQ